ncbi:restriction endonuclease subunit S [Ligilactobacillus salivarius]|uniref:restriction endonuclease subunit S n=4 Tax=Ligilactobacillus salivarius TaxID=1624 RepID=UPI0009DB4B39|nr:restriction endonuclease subunit S [Ligilactobacillus salivarius]OQR20700.1 restriction endonuclease subunit S [Ligilactobacillus salivarius]
MAKEEKKAPKLRFNGYTNDWERKELNNILKINSGRDYKQLNSGSIPVYGTGGYMLSVNDKLSDTDAVGIGRKGTIDKPLYLKAPFWTVDTLFYCTSKENSDVKFIYLLFQIINWKRYDESTGVPSLSKNTISNIKTYVPKIKEQDYISKLFFSLDNTLQLHERKYEELTLIKKALLQKLFPKKDGFKPEVRYKNFNDAWEQRKLGEVIISEHKGKVKSIMKGGNTNYLETNYLNGGTAQKVDAIADVSKDDVLILWDGSKAGTIYHGFEGALGSTLKAYVPKYSGDFLYQILKKNQDKIYQSYRTPNIPHVIKNFTEKFNVSIPTIIEQQEIGDFFKQLDSLITLHRRKLEKLKQLKKFLLQNMFI